MKAALLYAALLTTLLINRPVRAQTQADPVLVGTAADGGSDGFGTIFQFTPPASGTIIPSALSLTGTVGSNPTTNMVTVYNNKLYGMTRTGGTFDSGIIFVYDPVADTYTKLYDFNSSNGTLPTGSLTVYNNKLYGMTSSGGSQLAGVLFVFDPSTNIFTKLKDFSSADGSAPQGALTVYNNKLYGMTRSGGSNNSGVIFEFDPAVNSYTRKKDLSMTEGSSPLGSLTVYGTKLYGLTWRGGTFNWGVLFEFDPATNQYTKRKDFDATSPDGFAPANTMVVYNNKLYGTTFSNAASNYGVLFEYDPATITFTRKTGFASVSGNTPADLTVLGNELFGTLASSEIYSYNPANNTLALRKSFNFNNRFVEGYTTQGGLTVYNNRLYGMTNEGGTENAGVLYELNPTGNVYTKKRDFLSSNGRTPLSAPVYYNGKLYGTTRNGGANGAGVLYEYDPATRQYTKKKEFSAADGAYPLGGLLVHNCKLYGLTSEGGTGNGGVLFEYDPLANVYVKKRDFGNFNNVNGDRPYGSVAVFNNKLYGLTYYGGTNGAGVLFEYDLATSTYTKKRDLSNADGRGFSGRLTLFNNKFYGLMRINGSGSGTAGTGLGTLFEYDPQTNIFTKKQDFYSGPVGHSPMGSLVPLNNKLYGMNGSGVLFEYEPGSNAITPRYTFTTLNNAPYLPQGSLTVFRGKLYGQTRRGGLNGNGDVFRFDPALSGPTAYSSILFFNPPTTGNMLDPVSVTYEFAPQLTVFPDCQLSATATVASISVCVNDVVGVSVAVSGQNCQPAYSWTGGAFTRLSSPANSSAISATTLQAGTRSFSVTVTESLCSVTATTGTPAFDISSVQNGNWNNPATWSCGRVPMALDIVSVRHAVTLPSSYTANALRLPFDSATQLIYGLQARLRLGLP